MAFTIAEIVWLHWLLSDISISLSGLTPIYGDNKSAIQIAYNSVFHERIKHIDTDCHLTLHPFPHDTITFPFVSSVKHFSFLDSQNSMLHAS